MKNNIKRLIYLIKSDLKYLYLSTLKENKYKSFLTKEYKRRTGEELNIDSPKKYTEKMQYAKLYMNSATKTKLSDKYLVREWVENKIGAEYLIPLLGTWDDFDEIDFELLPRCFVLKLNNGSGTNLIVNDKSKLNYKKTKMKFKWWLKRNFAYVEDLQLHYADIQPKIIAEKYIQDSKGMLNDYKFFCFDGKPYYCWLDINNNNNHYRNIYDMDWKLQPWWYNKFENTPYDIPTPKNYHEMVEIARELSRGFSHVRVDLYNVDGKIFFGEMTFTSSGGYSLIYPEEYNYKLGNLWNVQKKNINDCVKKIGVI